MQPALAPERTMRRSREQILAGIRAAALQEFSTNGYAGTSTQAIATRAGLTKQQLHYYIEGKDALYAQLLTSLVAEWRGMFDTGSDDPGPVLSSYVRAKLRLAFEQPEVSRMFTREVLDGGRNLDAFWPEARKRTRAMTAAIDRWAAQGRIARVDAHALLMSIWSMTQFYADSALQVQQLRMPAVAGWTPQQEQLAQHLVTFVLRAVGLPA